MAIALFNPVRTQAALDALVAVVASGQIAGGPQVEAFRLALAGLVGNPQLITTDNMSSALGIALRLAGAGPGSEVIASPFACLSTNAPIALAGATAVWADIDPATGMLTPESVAPLITARTRAILLYHVAGYPGPAAALAALARAHGIALIEDCDTALGATQDGRPLGLAGDYAVWSFYPNRQLNTLEGGALACADPEHFARAQRLRRFGIDLPRFRDARGEIDPDADVPEIGWSAALGNAASAMGLAQLDGLADRLARTQANAARLAAALAGCPQVQPLAVAPGARPAYWGFLVRVPERDRVLARLKAQGIQASLLHHRTDDYSGFAAARRPLPGVERFLAEVIALPCGAWLDEAQIDTVGRTLVDAVSGNG